MKFGGVWLSLARKEKKKYSEYNLPKGTLDKPNARYRTLHWGGYPMNIHWWWWKSDDSLELRKSSICVFIIGYFSRSLLFHPLFLGSHGKGLCSLGLSLLTCKMNHLDKDQKIMAQGPTWLAASLCKQGVTKCRHAYLFMYCW